MFVIGTAGHVDHGKSTLVEALTGIDPDRLAEEKAREMTIDLGFAWLDLSATGGANLAQVGVIDVPGHRDFIENMLAGVGGIDLALFVVAADEGVMPQTREHLAILDLLEIPAGVVALTKTDLVTEPGWLELVMLELEEALAGTVLAGAPVVPVSARTGEGLEALRIALTEALKAATPRPDHGRPRLPIDRVFSLPGFGTIVTGTLVDGSLRLGDTVEVQPAGLKARVRGLQTHKTKLEQARPGSRVAINLTGVDKDELQRGDVVAAPGVVRGTTLLDVAYRHLPDAGAPLTHNMKVKLFVGAAEVMARTRVLGAQQIEPGQEGWLQLALQAPLATGRGDRFILRRPSPAATLGGGRVLDPHPGRQHRRFRPATIARLQTLAEGSPADLLWQALARQEPATPATLIQRAGLTEDAAGAAWQELLTEGRVVLLPGGQAVTRNTWEKLLAEVPRVLAAYHQEYPLRPGMPREELRGRLQVAGTLLNALLMAAQEAGEVVDTAGSVRLAGHTIRFSPSQQAAIERLLGQLAAAGVNTPSVKECRAAVGVDVYQALVALGQLRPLNEEVVYAAEQYDRLRAQLIEQLQRHGRLNAAGVRDLWQTSRKYAIAWLEHLDEERVTRRVGDERELVRPVAS